VILNVILLTTAFAVYLAFGVSGIYPGATQLINNFKSQQESSGAAASAIIGQLVFVIGFILLFFLLSYLSLTRIWRKTLKAQSLFFLFAFFTALPGMAIGTRSMIGSASPLFLVLLYLSLALVAWCCLDLVYALWRASGTPEISSFRATLDPRLASGFWARANKLLDLPRTPLQSPRSFAAYLLSLAGAIGLVTCLMTFINIDNVYSKAAEFASICENDPYECFGRTQSWAGAALIWILASFVGIRFFLTVSAFAKRMAALSVHEVLRDPSQNYVLYLRSFGTDEVKLRPPKLPLLSRILSPWPIPARVEEELFDVADGYMPLIAVGRPGAKQGEGGVAYREYLANDQWRSYVEDKIRGAKHVALLLNTTEGVLWELKHVLALGAGPKTLFLFDPKGRDEGEWRRIADTVLPVFTQQGLISPTFKFSAQAIAFYFDDASVIQIQNENWSSTSYRTAFSYFLSAHAASRPRKA
jgi:hypothetical protein